ncbi:MAG: guanylate kinase [Pseudomonadota bacterium]
MSETEKLERRGLLLVLSSPSGAGKSTLSQRLLDADPRFELSVSVTTRLARPGEIEGKHYYFTDKSRFLEMVENRELLEHAQVFDHFYGTPSAPVEAAIDSGKDVLFDVDWQGAQQIGASDLAQAVVKIFILPPSIAEIERRLIDRATDEKKIISRRMAQAKAEISHWAEYDYVLINDDLDKCSSQIETIVAAERLRWTRQKWVFGKVNGLYREFEERIG